MTKIDRLYNLLASGKPFTAKQIQKRTGLSSVSAAVRDLRNEGAQIYLNVRGRSGNKVRQYRMAA